MRKVFGLLGATIGGWIGWYLGAGLSLFSGYMLGIFGTALGLYLGYRLADRYT